MVTASIYVNQRMVMKKALKSCVCLLTGEDGLRCGVRCNVPGIRGAYVWCNVQQYGSYWKTTPSVHSPPSLVISEYHSYQPCYVIIGVNDLKVILTASSLFYGMPPSAIEDNGFTVGATKC